MTSIRKLLLQIALPLTKMLNKLHISPSYRRVKRADVEKARLMLIPGDIILTYTNGQLSNQLIPGDWKHAAIFSEDKDSEFVVEAVNKGVVKTDIYDFLMSKDGFAILRPVNVSMQQSLKASEIAQMFIGRQYDFFFEPSSEAFYCSELILTAYAAACPQFSFYKRSVMGMDTVLPSDYYDAKEKFFIVQEKR